MFIEFYYLLRDVHIPVSITEFLALMEVMAKGMIRSAQDFYYVARALLVKDECHFDAFDDAFMHYFRDAAVPPQLKDELEKWLEAPIDILLDQLQLTPEERDRLRTYDWQELQRLFTERMQEQQEAHQGGNHWIGTQGTSPFGWGGNHPGGIRVGGWGGARSAVQIAQRRYFREYRSDRILDTRQVTVALRKLRKLSKIGAPDVLNLDETIRKTCQLGGEIELIWEKRKKNNLKLLLLMDVGGSMTPFTLMVEQLFSAANKSNHFKKFHHFYFHNCLYQYLYQNADLWDGKKHLLTDVFKKFDSEYRVVIVGDAAMAPYELTMRYGAIDYYQQNDTAGIVWLKRFKKHFPHTVWLNPEVPGPWIAQSRQMVAAVFPMFQLSIDGLGEAIEELIKK